MKKLMKSLLSLGLVFSLGLSLTGCANEPDEPTLGPTVVEDDNSPTGYTVTFVYEPAENVTAVSVTGPFQYVDPTKELKDPENAYTPHEFVNGMYASNCAPGPFSWGYTEAMTLNEETGMFEVSFPISSGSFAYSYVVTYNEPLKDENGNFLTSPTAVVVAQDGSMVDMMTQQPINAEDVVGDTFEGNLYGQPATMANLKVYTATIDDPANPSPAKLNENSNTPTGDLTHSIVYGKWHETKQSESPNLDFVIPTETTGTLTYVEYKGNLAENQDIGIYLPSSYDENREEPYKVVYASHGGGGNETDWFAMGHVDNIVENIKADVIVVTMDNAAYVMNGVGNNWDFTNIEDNVLNYIIPYMEDNYNVSTEAKDRAFCGLSMGSMTTLHMFFDHPEEFGYFGAFSAADMDAVKDNPAIQESVLYTTIGTCDIASRNVMPNPGKQYEDLIEWEAENELAKFIDGGYIEGAHDWFTWSESMETFISEVCWK